MAAADNKEVSRRWLEEGYGHGNLELLNELASDTLLAESSLAAQIEAFHIGFPDLAAVVEEQIAEGDRVMTRATFTGTHTGDLMGFAPTGRPLRQSLVEIHTVRDGHIVDAWNDFSFAELLMQLRLVQPPS